MAPCSNSHRGERNIGFEARQLNGRVSPARRFARTESVVRPCNRATFDFQPRLQAADAFRVMRFNAALPI